MQLIDLETARTVHRLGRGAAQSFLAFHVASRRIAVCTTVGVHVLDWDSGQVVVELPGETAAGTGVAWHPSGQAIAISGLASGCELWDVSERRMLNLYPHRGPITDPHFSRDGELLLTYDYWTGELNIWNTGTGQEVLRSPEFPSFTGDRSSSESDTLLCLQPSGLTLWRIDTGLATYPLVGAPNTRLATCTTSRSARTADCSRSDALAVLSCGISAPCGARFTAAVRDACLHSHPMAT